jgi:hypothetical protein
MSIRVRFSVTHEVSSPIPDRFVTSNPDHEAIHEPHLIIFTPNTYHHLSNDSRVAKVYFPPTCITI